MKHRAYQGYRDWIIYLALQLSMNREHLGDAHLATAAELKEARQFLHDVGVLIPGESSTLSVPIAEGV